MLIASVLVLALAVAAVAATLVELRRDGFRRIPTDASRIPNDARRISRSPRAERRGAPRAAGRVAPTPQHAR